MVPQAGKLVALSKPVRMAVVWDGREDPVDVMKAPAGEI